MASSPARLRIQIDGDISGLLRDFGQRARPAIQQTFEEKRPVLRAAFQREVSSKLRLNGRKVLASVHTFLLNKPGRMPALVVRSNIPWLGVHQEGARVMGKKMLAIPLLKLNGGRIDKDRWERTLQDLNDRRALFTRVVNGRVLLFANYRKGVTSNSLAEARRQHRKQSGANPNDGQAFPIAVLMHTVDIQRRLDMPVAIQRLMPDIIESARQSLLAQLARPVGSGANGFRHRRVPNQRSFKF